MMKVSAPVAIAPLLPFARKLVVSIETIPPCGHCSELVDVSVLPAI
jgi:hypothetical protein